MNDDPIPLHVQARQKKFKRELYEDFQATIDECLLRLKAGETTYKESDVTASVGQLMARDLIAAAIEELLDNINYSLMEVAKLRCIAAALESNAEIQQVAPSGKPKAKTGTL